jgi:hypothetical protein
MGEAKRRQEQLDGQVDGEYREKMLAVVQSVDRLFNGEPDGQMRKTGVVLLVFPFGEELDGRVNYMSNGARREDMIILFKEMIARFEGQPHISGTA